MVKLSDERPVFASICLNIPEHAIQYIGDVNPK